MTSHITTPAYSHFVSHYNRTNSRCFQLHIAVNLGKASERRGSANSMGMSMGHLTTRNFLAAANKQGNVVSTNRGDGNQSYLRIINQVKVQRRI